MTKFYLISTVLGIYLFYYFQYSPNSSELSTSTVPAPSHFSTIVEEPSFLRIEAVFDPEFPVSGGLQWGENTEKIRLRVDELREESSMFNQMLLHLEESQYPYFISNTCLETAYGAYSSKDGNVQFEVDKLHDFFFDATIIEEFAHAYQALYYNYTHGKLRAQLYKQAWLQGKEYDAARKNGIVNWEKYGRKHVFIESEAKLMTFFIQHQTCTISMQDIIDTDDYNTGGKGRKLINKYLKKYLKLDINTAHKLGHLGYCWVDLPTFALYQQYFLQYWKQKAPGSNYTVGYFYHKPDALNNLYQPIASVF